ncbi:RNA polymerase subunit sigma-24 [Acidihalobacter aeolianus]|uniref:RNA polymerase sigma factor n=2 Tax=Acidihalobacter aeolianus TaxID=2792603 RepID=A0A1D8KBP5_9GAMM|nr:RNA polymerase subunit sigma-24 [Acidihalobacter aeolianus]
MGMFDRITLSKQFKKRIADERPRLYRMAYAWCCDPALADDLAQEAIAKGLQKAGQLREAERLQSWLYAILHNCWRTHLRRQRPDQPLDEEAFPCDECPETVNQRQQVVDRVRGAIKTLPLGQREVITLVDLKGFAYAEVAQILDIPIGTVMSRLSRARQALLVSLADVQQQPQTTIRTSLRRVK